MLSPAPREKGSGAEKNGRSNPSIFGGHDSWRVQIGRRQDNPPMPLRVLAPVGREKRKRKSKGPGQLRRETRCLGAGGQKGDGYVFAEWC